MSFIFGLMPHGTCFLWDPWLTSLHVISDLGVAIAYFSIPLLLYLNRDHIEAPMRPLLLLFAAFILSCGIGHSLKIWNIWHASYWLEGGWTAITAAISLYTALQLRLLVPNMLSTQQQLVTTQAMLLKDPLTGIANRRGLETAIETLPGQRGSQPLRHSLILLDLDGFKQVNDRHGHMAGDNLLKAVADVLETQTRSIDLAVRLGGDEFALLMVGCSMAEAQAIAEKLRQAIQRIRLSALPQAGAGPLISVSIGISEIDPQHPFKQAYREADAALYQAKHGGKNQVITHLSSTQLAQG
jgi:diguanylate cyclase (GGDEF)-like protein